MGINRVENDIEAFHLSLTSKRKSCIEPKLNDMMIWLLLAMNAVYDTQISVK